MHRTLKAIFRLTLYLTLLAVTPLGAQDTNPTTRGTAIGTTIKAAIDAALPGVSAVMNLIWPGGGDNDQKRKKEVQENVDKALQELRMNAQSKLSGLNSVVAEMQAIDKFTSASLRATPYLARIDVLLTKPSLDTTDWENISIFFEQATVDLKKLQQVSDKEIDSIREVAVQQIVRTIRDDVIVPKLISVSARIKSRGSLEQLRADTVALFNGLRTINGLGTLELNQLNRELKPLQDFANGAAGGGDATSSPDADLLRAIRTVTDVAKGN